MTTAGAVAPVRVVLSMASEADELRAFLAAYGAGLGWQTWACTCGVEGEAPTADDAWRAWRVHYVSEHVPEGDQARAWAENLTVTALEAGE